MKSCTLYPNTAWLLICRYLWTRILHHRLHLQLLTRTIWQDVVNTTVLGSVLSRIPPGLICCTAQVGQLVGGTLEHNAGMQWLNGRVAILEQ